jgi:hypothetical protein
MGTAFSGRRTLLQQHTEALRRFGRHLGPQ